MRSPKKSTGVDANSLEPSPSPTNRVRAHRRRRRRLWRVALVVAFVVGGLIDGLWPRWEGPSLAEVGASKAWEWRRGVFGGDEFAGVRAGVAEIVRVCRGRSAKRTGSWASVQIGGVQGGVRVLIGGGKAVDVKVGEWVAVGRFRSFEVVGGGRKGEESVWVEKREGVALFVVVDEAVRSFLVAGDLLVGFEGLTEYFWQGWQNGLGGWREAGVRKAHDSRAGWWDKVVDDVKNVAEDVKEIVEEKVDL